MCVDPRRLVRSGGGSRVLDGGRRCGPRVRRCATTAGGLGEAQPAARVLTAAERAAWYQECWAHFNGRAWEQFRACYADTVESEQVGSGQPAARGIEAPAVSNGFTEAFPDMKGSGELILVKGDAIVSVYVLSGTHTGPLLGPDGHSIPATSKPVGFFRLTSLQTDA